MMTRPLLVSALLFLAGCPDEPGSEGDDVVGSWRIFSETIYFDSGGSNAIDPVTERLQIGGDGEWLFGDSSGAWSAVSIEPEDWTRWDIEPYGPTRRLLLDGWSGASADGPIEETEAGVDFLWVIYHSDEADPGTIWMKLGH